MRSRSSSPEIVRKWAGTCGEWAGWSRMLYRGRLVAIAGRFWVAAL
jgi:hypothetical protein